LDKLRIPHLSLMISVIHTFLTFKI